MRVFKGSSLIILFLLISFLSLLKPPLSYAVLCPNCTATIDPPAIYTNSTGSINITITSPLGNTFVIGAPYSFRSSNNGNPSNIILRTIDGTVNTPKVKVESDKIFKTTIPLLGNWTEVGNWRYQLWGGSTLSALNSNTLIFEGTYAIYPKGNTGGSGLLSLSLTPSVVQIANPTTLKVHNVDSNQYYRIYWEGAAGNLMAGTFPSNDISNETVDGKIQPVGVFNISGNDVGNTARIKTICVDIGGGFLNTGKYCSYHIGLTIQMTPPKETTTATSGKTGVPDSSIPVELAPIDAPKVSPPCGEGCFDGVKCICVDTAIGEISTDPAKFVQRIFSMVLGLAGGIALILIILSGYKFMTSGGNPEATKAATEQLTSAIIGLLFIILSFVILQIIGVNILRIPGFQP